MTWLYNLLIRLDWEPFKVEPHVLVGYDSEHVNGFHEMVIPDRTNVYFRKDGRVRRMTLKGNWTIKQLQERN